MVYARAIQALEDGRPRWLAGSCMVQSECRRPGGRWATRLGAFGGPPSRMVPRCGRAPPTDHNGAATQRQQRESGPPERSPRRPLPDGAPAPRSAKQRRKPLPAGHLQRPERPQCLTNKKRRRNCNTKAAKGMPLLRV